MLGSVLNGAARSTRARRAVESVSATRRVVDRFVAGEEIPQAVEAARRTTDAGRLVTIDVLGEDVCDLVGAQRTRSAYISLLYALFEAGLSAGADLSLKLSALGQSIPKDGHTLAETHAAEICVAAAAVGATVTLDMESHPTVDSTLRIGEELRREYPTVGNVLQSNLRRTAGDIADLSGKPTRIRLVKGAYREPGLAFQRRAEVDGAYREDVTSLMESQCYPMIATHDAAMLRHARQVATVTRRGASEWETQMLYGVRTDLQAESVNAGERMRVYIPFGSDWYGYFMRRLAERPANVSFFLRALAHR